MSAAVVTGTCLGISAALGVVVELPDDNKTVQKAFSNNNKAAVISTCLSIGIGVFCGPVSGVISELIIYPACWFKVGKIKRSMKKYEQPTVLMEDATSEINNDVSISTIKTLFRK